MTAEFGAGVVGPLRRRLGYGRDDDVERVSDGACRLDIERLDRICLNGYVPNLQVPEQVSSFMTAHLGYPIPSPAIMERIGTASLPLTPADRTAGYWWELSMRQIETSRTIVFDQACLQAQIDAGQRRGATTEELAEIKELKAKVRRLEDDNDILRRATIFFAGGPRPPRPMIVGFIDECRQAGHAVEAICAVPTEQGCQIAARTYRAWSRTGQQVAGRTISDVVVMDAVRDAAWTVDTHGPMADVRRLTPEGLYGGGK